MRTLVTVGGIRTSKVPVFKWIVDRIINALAQDVAMLGMAIICSLHILLWDTSKNNLSDV